VTGRPSSADRRPEEVAVRPLLLSANQPRSFYRGAGRISAFRNVPPPPDAYHPEDWVGSTTARFGQSPAGLTTLPDGRLLRAAVEADPMGWLGQEHVERHGNDTAVLVKLLDAGERLPLHAHPDRDFAGSHLASPYGKTEAWVIVQAAPDAAVHLGFSRDVEAGELDRWVADQKIETMLAATNRLPVRAGDAVLCPAGVPHAIGEGILLVELQEPTDFSVLLEWEGFAIDGPAEGHLGMGFDTALGCVDRASWSPARIDAELRGVPGGRPVRDGVTALLPPAADGFFTAERVEARPRLLLDAAFAVLVVLEGSGMLVWSPERDTLEVRAGDTVLVPHSAGPCLVEGPLTAVRCRTAP
jgi:mannose-6-phosphate isomerase